MKIALLGAESSGKAQLVARLRAHVGPDAGLVSLVEASELASGSVHWQQRFDVTLLLALDTQGPPVDALQDAHICALEQADASIRAALSDVGVAYRVVYGAGPERLANAIAAIGLGAVNPNRASGADPRWQWSCEKCGDSQCEHRLFANLREQRT